eukprot:244175-Hanusia_phi.AAC.3
MKLPGRSTRGILPQDKRESSLMDAGQKAAFTYSCKSSYSFLQGNSSGNLQALPGGSNVARK